MSTLIDIANCNKSKTKARGGGGEDWDWGWESDMEARVAGAGRCSRMEWWVRTGVLKKGWAKAPLCCFWSHAVRDISNWIINHMNKIYLNSNKIITDQLNISHSTWVNSAKYVSHHSCYKSWEQAIATYLTLISRGIWLPPAMPNSRSLLPLMSVSILHLSATQWADRARKKF